MSFKTASNQYVIEGFSAISEYIRHRPQALKSISYSLKHESKVKQLVGSHKIQLIPLKEDKQLRDKAVSSSSIHAFVEVHYQSFLNMLKQIENKNDQKLILALDHITDPRNLGAIARSAAFFGVKYILIPKMRQVLLTEASVATSQGAFAYTELVLVTNLNQSIEQLKECGYWILSSDSEGESYERLVGKFEKIVLVLGSEGFGVSALLKKRSDQIVSIHSNKQVLDSLNVSVAAGILLNAFSK